MAKKANHARNKTERRKKKARRRSKVSHAYRSNRRPPVEPPEVDNE